MICGALQTLNEEAFEDVASSERPSPSGLPTGEMLAAAAQLQLAPIRESSEFGSPSDDLKFNHFLQYANNNNYGNFHTQQNNHSDSTHSLQSIGIGGGGGGVGGNNTIHMGNGGTGVFNTGHVGGGIGAGDMYKLRHSIVGDASTQAAVQLLANQQQQHQMTAG